MADALAGSAVTSISMTPLKLVFSLKPKLSFRMCITQFVWGTINFVKLMLYLYTWLPTGIYPFRISTCSPRVRAINPSLWGPVNRVQMFASHDRRGLCVCLQVHFTGRVQTSPRPRPTRIVQSPCMRTTNALLLIRVYMFYYRYVPMCIYMASHSHILDTCISIHRAVGLPRCIVNATVWLQVCPSITCWWLGWCNFCALRSVWRRGKFDGITIVIWSQRQVLFHTLSITHVVVNLHTPTVLARMVSIAAPMTTSVSMCLCLCLCVAENVHRCFVFEW